MDLDKIDALQTEMAKRILIPKDGMGLQLQPGDIIFTIDVQYVGDVGFVAVDCMKWEEGHLQIFALFEDVTEEYVPGYFAFREGPLLMKAIERVKAYSGISPTLVIVDGHGLAHPRKFGVACWLGLELNVATLGCAKEPLVKFDGDLDEEVGSTLPVEVEGEIVGHVLRTAEGTKPVFVSPGHLISLEETIRIVLALRSKYRIIEPIRRADQAARAYAKGLHTFNMTYID